MDFRKGIKRDKNHYEDFKNQNNWEDWKRATIATAYSHHCENVLDKTYVPTTREEELLFEEQKIFMYSVWTTKLHVYMAKHIV